LTLLLFSDLLDSAITFCKKCFSVLVLRVRDPLPREYLLTYMELFLVPVAEDTWNRLLW